MKFKNKKKSHTFFILLLLLHNTALASMLQTTIGASSLIISIIMALEAQKEYALATADPKNKKTIKERSDLWVIKSWNKIQRVLLGKASFPDIMRQQLTETIVQSSYWWRCYHEIFIKGFISFSLGLMGVLYTRKAFTTVGKVMQIKDDQGIV